MLVCAQAELIDASGNRTNKLLNDVKNFRKYKFNSESVFRFIAYYQNPFQGASMMFKREFIKYALPIPSGVAYHDMWFALVGSVMDSFNFIEYPVTLYRIHSNNTSGEHKHHITIRTIGGHFLKIDLGNNRKAAIDAIDASDNIKAYNPLLIDEAKAYYKDRKFWTRLRNLIFELKNYSSIYGKN